MLRWKVQGVKERVDNWSMVVSELLAGGRRWEREMEKEILVRACDETK